MTRVSKKEIGRTFKALEGFFSAPENQRLAKNGFTSADPYKVTAATGAKALCTRYCSLLGLTQQKFTNLAEGLATKMTTVGDLAGRSPLSVAAACIWMASHLLNQPRSAKEIANVAGVSDGTVRTAYKHLYQERARLIEPAWIAKADGGPQAAMDRLPVA
jgi:transcription initiation factor TFIIB